MAAVISGETLEHLVVVGNKHDQFLTNLQHLVMLIAAIHDRRLEALFAECSILDFYDGGAAHRL